MRRLKNSRLGTVIGTPDTLPRPPSHASSDAVVAQAQAFLREAGLYIRSYLLIRTCVGIIGVALPFALLIGEATIRGSITARGSISAYYHSSMQSLFVGALCIVAFLLLTYMSGQPRTIDFRFSTAAGIALFTLVMFPTRRPGASTAPPRCGPDIRPEPEGCSWAESTFGEHGAAIVHGVGAALFIASLALISYAFAYRDYARQRAADAELGGPGGQKRAADSRKRRGWRPPLHLTCASVIVLAALWAALGSAFDWFHILRMTPLYLGELVSVIAFGVSWFVAGNPARLAQPWKYPVP